MFERFSGSMKASMNGRNTSPADGGGSGTLRCARNAHVTFAEWLSRTNTVAIVSVSVPFCSLGYPGRKPKSVQPAQQQPAQLVVLPLLVQTPNKHVHGILLANCDS
jgi:hypothetical protein